MIFNILEFNTKQNRINSFLKFSISIVLYVSISINKLHNLRIKLIKNNVNWIMMPFYKSIKELIHNNNIIFKNIKRYC